MPPRHTSLIAIALLALTLWSSIGQANFDLDRLDAPPPAFKQSPLNSDNPQSLSSSPLNISFLPVEQAYQLSATLNNPQLLIHWDIADGYYLYKHKLKLVIDGKPLILDLPDGIKKYDDYFEEELQVFYQTLDLSITLPIESIGKPLDIIVHSQGCADAGLCYPPQQQILRIESGTVNLINSPALPISAQAQPAPLLPTSMAPASMAGFLVAALSALFGGMLLNLMPCVFPVLSLKALSLANNKNHPQQHRHGWAYTAGVVATFVLIAAIMLFLRQAGQAIGWGFQLQSPVIVALLAYLFFIMGLALSGLLNLGASFSGSGQSLTEGHSYRSSFFTGALASVVASPCTAPLMGGALGYAVTQPAAIAITIFVALGFGMALPFLLLTYFPSLSRRLPKPGQWMETLKQLLAFPLYLTALWLLWVVGRQTNTDTVVTLIAGAVGLTFAAWLWQHRPARLWQKLLALLVVCSAAWPIAQINPDQHSSTAPNTTTSTTPLEHNWQPYTQARLDQLLDSGTPVFVNLTADWCITCLANEKIALDTETSVNAFKQAGIVKLKGDWTHYNAEITHLLSQFGRNGVPLYLLYTGNKDELPVILPQILRERTVINAIDSIKTPR